LPIRLTELESLIEVNQVDFYALGKALKEINEHRLYQQSFKSFEDYVKQRWDMRRAQAYRLINAAQVMDNLSPIGDIALPKNEAQARALTQLEATEQKKLWQLFVQSNLPLTALTLRHFVESYTRKKIPSTPIDDFNVISNDYKNATMALLEQIKRAQNEPWQNTSRTAALHWNNVMRTLICKDA